jgi:HAE1 family hydrophobic/amphiphilic exporter-1
MDLPAGTSLEAMDELSRQVDVKIRSHPEVSRTVLTVGGEHGERNQASILVLLKPSRQRRASTNEMKERTREDLLTFPQAASRVEDLLDIGGGAGQPFVMNLTGEDLGVLQRVSADIVDRLRQSPDLKDVDRSFRSGASELRWVIDPERAREFGISSGEVGQELRLFVAGATPARFHDAGKEYDIRVRLKADQRDLARTAPLLSVPNLNHRLIPLEAVARRSEAESPANISRQDRKRLIEITAGINPRGKGLARALDETRRMLTPGTPGGITLPTGVSYEFSGQTRDFQDLLTSVVVAVVLSIAFMYLVLASLYESFFIPFSIMLVLPLAVCGAFYALGITGSSLDIYSCVGCVLLLGVAAKNSILLVDYIHEGVREGKDLKTAILRAGEIRLRPILMTSFALIAGMLPMALPFQEAAKSRAPMAIAVIGGVVSSTLLTLVVVPAAYRYILAFERWVLRVTGMARD